MVKKHPYTYPLKPECLYVARRASKPGDFLVVQPQDHYEMYNCVNYVGSMSPRKELGYAIFSIENIGPTIKNEINSVDFGLSLYVGELPQYTGCKRWSGVLYYYADTYFVEITPEVLEILELLYEI